MNAPYEIISSTKHFLEHKRHDLLCVLFPKQKIEHAHSICSFPKLFPTAFLKSILHKPQNKYILPLILKHWIN